MRSCQPLKMGRMLCVRVKARAHLASFEFYSFETHARLPPGACAGRGRAWRVQRRVRSCRTAPHCGRFAPRVVPLLLCFVWVTCVGQVYVLYGLNTLAPYPYECCSYCAPLPLSYHAARTAPHCPLVTMLLVLRPTASSRSTVYLRVHHSSFMVKTLPVNIINVTIYYLRIRASYQCGLRSQTSTIYLFSNIWLQDACVASGCVCVLTRCWRDADEMLACVC